jgi:hypothetical protein
MLDRETKRCLEQVKLRTAGLPALPLEVQWLLAEATTSSGGDLEVAIARLRQRFLVDASMAAERASLVHWLLECDARERLVRRGWRAEPGQPRRWCPPEPLMGVLS